MTRWIALWASLAHAAPELPARAAIFVSSDMRGYLGPCGCSENMRGGIDRAAYQVSQAKQGGLAVAYVDCGDSLFGHEKLTPAEAPQETRKAQALAEAMRRMGLFQRTVGELDNSGGRAFRKGLGLPEGADGAAHLLSLAGHQLGIVSAQDEAQLRVGAERARAKGAQFVLGLVHDSFDHVLKYGPSPVDLVVASHAPTPLTGEDNRLVRGALNAVSLQSKGRSLLRLDLSFAGRGPLELLKTQADLGRELSALEERIALLKKQIDAPSLKPELKALYQGKLSELVQRREGLSSAPMPNPTGGDAFSARFVALEATLPQDPDVRGLVERYDRDVAQANLAWAKAHGQDCAPPQKGEASYVGNEPCKDCHAESFPVWSASKHQRAYEDLAKAQKNYRVDCIKCHVVGYQAPGGVCRVDKVFGRTGVGCEDCHGPGSIHSDDPTNDNIVRKPGKERCLGCHDPENSPHFDFALYLPEILGPGHGRPLPDGGGAK